jgi:hypothetical protein
MQQTEKIQQRTTQAQEQRITTPNNQNISYQKTTLKLKSRNTENEYNPESTKNSDKPWSRRSEPQETKLRWRCAWTKGERLRIKRCRREAQPPAKSRKTSRKPPWKFQG